MSILRSPVLLIVVTASIFLTACGEQSTPAKEVVTGATSRLGVLIVSHGSDSSTWKEAVEELVTDVKIQLKNEPEVAAVELAYVTTGASSIGEKVRMFDKAGYDQVIIIPLFLSSISTINDEYFQFLIGTRSDLKTLKKLKNEGYDIYFPKLRINLTPALDRSNVIKKNVLRRVKELQGNESGEDMAIVLVGYGDKKYGSQMEALMSKVGRYLKIKTDIDTVAFAFAGNVVEYSGDQVVRVIKEVLDLEEVVLVVPVLLSVDEMIQTNSIQAAINFIEQQSKVRYQPTAMLPDPKVNNWVVTKVTDVLGRLREEDEMR
jgi:hypothetical protein